MCLPPARHAAAGAKGRAAHLDEDGLRQILQQVPGTTVHRDLAAFADHLVGNARGGGGAVASAPREAA